MIYQFGSLKFEATTGFTALSISKEKQFIQQERLGNKPTLQEGGGVLDTIDAEITFDQMLPGDSNGTQDVEAAIKKIVDIMEKGQAESFIDGKGVILGVFVITKISTPIRRTDLEGNVISADMSISFLESVDEEYEDKEARAARKSAFANISVSPIEYKKVPQFQSPATQVMRDITAGTASANAASQHIKKAADIKELIVKHMEQGKRALADAKAALTKGREGIATIEQKINNANQIRTTLDATLNDINNLQNNYFPGSIQGLKSISTNLDNNVSRLYSVTSTVVGLNLLRQ